MKARPGVLVGEGRVTFCQNADGRAAVIVDPAAGRKSKWC